MLEYKYMKLIIGLGNPGKDYLNTRHNVGYKVIDELQNQKLPKGVMVKKTDTFMNDSGRFVSELTKRYSLNAKDLFIVHDDLDILLGSYKIQFGRGPKDHNGLSSIDSELGNNEYWHVRVGVDRRDPLNRVMGEEYVLQDFSDEENNILDKTIKEVVNKLITSLHD